MQFMWDIVSTYVKYEEGFIVYEGNIITKPFGSWSPTHQRNMMAMDYVECVTFSLQVGVFFLMQSFWNYLSNSVARKSFMGSFEFKFYIVWALASMAMFPVLQWVYREDVSKREVIPQLAYGIEGLITSVLGIRSHFRFKRIIALSQRNNGTGNKTIVTRLAYFKDMNALVSLILFSYSASIILLCADGLTTAKIINRNKFATDTVIANANICTVFLCLLLISIFHPRPQYTRGGNDSTNTQNESSFRYSSNRVQNDATANYVVNESVNGFSGNLSEKNKFGGPAINTHNTSNNNNNQGGFMRAMSPVTVDYPHSLTNDTIPLTASTGTGRPLSPEAQQMAYRQQQQQPKPRNVAVEDPYNNEPVMFTMMDVSSSKNHLQRYGSPSSPSTASRNDIPLRGMNSMDRSRTMSPQQRRYIHEEDDDYMDVNPNVGYIDHKQTTAPHQIRRPSWEQRGSDINDVNAQSMPQQPLPGQQGDQMVRDWLWQSPDRRNA